MRTLPQRMCEAVIKLFGTAAQNNGQPNLCDRVDALESNPPVITVDRKTAQLPWAGIRTDGTLFNATVTEDAEGQWTMTFNSPHPSGSGGYLYQGTGEEDADRDNPKITMVEGTDTASGVQIMVTVDDNGGAADIFEDNDYSFIVYAECEFISEVYVNGVAPTANTDVPDDGEEPSIFPECGFGITNFFNEQQFAWGFSIQNTSGTETMDPWQYVISGADYQIDVTQISNSGDFVYQEIANADGTFDHVFTGVAPLGPNQSTSTFQWNGVNFGFDPSSTSQSVNCG